MGSCKKYKEKKKIEIETVVEFREFSCTEEFYIPSFEYKFIKIVKYYKLDYIYKVLLFILFESIYCYFYVLPHVKYHWNCISDYEYSV